MPDPRPLDRLVVSVTFFANGAVVSSWAPHIPFARERLGLTDGQLGLAFLCMAAGAIAGMQSSGRASARWGAHRTTRIGAGLLLAALPLPLLAPTYPAFAACLALLGAGIGTMDVSMNTVASEVERSQGRTMMSSFHALFSLGAITGSAVTSATIALGVPPLTHTLLTSVVAAALLVVALAALPDARPETQAEAGRRHAPSRSLLLIGLLAFAGLVTEGSVYDWGSTLLHHDFGASAAVAGLAYGVFHVAMFATRLVGDRVRERLGPVATVRWGAAVAALGLAASIALRTPAAGLAGFAAMGLGLGNVVPVVFSAAARRSTVAALGISTAATFGYAGFLVGPPVIGRLADHVGLPGALLVVVGLCLFLVAAAQAVRPPQPETQSTPAERITA